LPYSDFDEYLGKRSTKDINEQSLNYAEAIEPRFNEMFAIFREGAFGTWLSDYEE
jgi:hypothetical protein